MKIADRISHISEYYFATKLSEIRALQSEGRDIINLGIGSPDMMPHESVIDALTRSAESEGAYQYKPYRGIEGLRTAIAEWYERLYSVELSESSCLPLIGSKEGIGFISLAFLNEGDNVLAPNPGYLAYQSATRLAGGEVVPYNMNTQSSWLPDPTEIERFITDRTKIIWLNFPSMPVGAQASTEVVSAILEIAADNDILVVNDNPYSLVLFEDAFSVHQIPARGHVLELNSLSKSCNLAGMRFGMLTGRSDLIDSVFKVQSNLESGMFEPTQKAAIAAMQLGRDWFDKINTAYRARRNIVNKMMDELGCEIEGSEGGLFVWARIPNGLESAVEFVGHILDTYEIFVAPGSIFGSNGERYVRLSLCTKESRLREAYQRIKDRK